MPQIAQQDYIRIEIGDNTALTDTEKAELAAKVANGTIFDCIIVCEGGEGRVMACDATDKGVYYYDPIDVAVIKLDYSE